jgi:LacI family transcriptional regulator
LPPETELAKSLGVGRHTVRLALAELSEAGMVERKKKRGTIVTLERSEQTLGAKRSGFALVLPEVNSGVYPSLMKGFTEGAMTCQQQSMICETGMDVYRQGDTILRLIQSGVAGVAVVPPYVPMPDHQVLALRSLGIPLVFCHRRTTALPAPLIRWSWEEVGRLAGDTLAKLGHRRIAFVDSARSVVSDGYVAGLRDSLGKFGVPFSDDSIYYGDHVVIDAELQQYAEEISARILDRPDRPTAVFCADDYLSERLYLTATRAGIRIPEELSIIGFGPTFRDGPMRQGLAVVAVDEMETGRQAARLLSEMSAGVRPLDDNEELVLPLTVLKGKSLGPAIAGD